jgi:hypothetical protein
MPVSVKMLTVCTLLYYTVLYALKPLNVRKLDYVNVHKKEPMFMAHHSLNWIIFLLHGIYGSLFAACL